MERCLLCLKGIEKNSNLVQYLIFSDYLCPLCRKDFNLKPISFKLNECDVYALYPYQHLIKTAILQFKENYDEALDKVFLYPLLNKLKRKYKGYTVIFVPSSKENIERRGFNHLYLIYKNLKLPMLNVFYKDGNYNQNLLSAKDRKKIKEHICLRNINLPKKILLVDDIITTGSSLKACIDLLKNKQINIKCLIISYTLNWENFNNL